MVKNIFYVSVPCPHPLFIYYLSTFAAAIIDTKQSGSLQHSVA